MAMSLLAACSGGEQQQPQMPPAIVEVVTVETGAVPNIVELPGRIEAVRTAEVRPRTDGIIERRLFDEGSYVREGTPLFVIDPRDYRAQVQSARAGLDRALAARTNALQIVRRYQPLVSERAVSAQEYDAAQSELRQAEAQVGEARAALSRAQLLLSYTTVRAPISGRVGRAQVTEGALASATQSEPLTRIDQVTPVYAVFTISSAEVLNATQQADSGNLALPGIGAMQVRLKLENGSDYGPAGRLDLAEATVAPETGTQLLRAQFPNPDGMLKPGEFVRGRIEAGVIANGTTVPARAVQIRGEQASVSLLAADGSVVSRPVVLGDLLGARWVIKSGLKRGERVIVEGWQNLQPGRKAQVKGAQPPQGQAQGQTKASDPAKGH